MTETQGYPDYQRLSAQAANLIDFIQAPIGGNPTSTWQDSQGFGYINLSVNDLGGTGYFSVQIAWSIYTSSQGQLSTFYCIPTPGGQQTLQIPVIARYFQVEIAHISGVTTDRPLVAWFGANVLAPDQINSQPAAPFLSFVQTVAAGATYTQMATTTIQGAANFHILDSTNNLWNASVAYYNGQTQGWQNYIFVEGSQYGQGANLEIGLPPAPLQVSITNTDTASHTFHGSLTLL
jgi:hypothetical protein